MVRQLRVGDYLVLVADPNNDSWSDQPYAHGTASEITGGTPTPTVTATATPRSREADPAVTVADEPDPVRERGVLVYRVTVANNGPADATGMRLTMRRSVAVDIRSVRTDPRQLCSGPELASGACDLGDVASGETMTLRVRVRPQADGSLRMVAVVDGGQPDRNRDNNRATRITTVVDR